MKDHIDPLKSEGLYATEDEYIPISEDMDMQSIKIEPRKYKKDNIFRVYVSNTSIHSELKNKIKEIILEQGDSIIEFLGDKFDEKALSQIKWDKISFKHFFIRFFIASFKSLFCKVLVEDFLVILCVQRAGTFLEMRNQPYLKCNI